MEQSKTIMQAVDKDHEIAIRCVGTLNRVLYDKDFLARFDNTYSAHIVNYLQHAIHRDGIMCVCRMWDDDRDALSVCNLMTELQKTQVLKAIKARRRQAKLEIIDSADGKRIAKLHGEGGQDFVRGFANRDADQAEADVDKALAELISLCGEDELRGLLIRAGNWRNKYIGHSVEKTRLETRSAKKGLEIDALRWGELERTLTLTSGIVQRLWVMVDDLSIFPNDKHAHWRQYSDAFWNSFSETPE